MKLKHPFTCIVAGPTKVGKTEWTKRLVKDASLMIEPPPKRIIWCYKEWQPGYHQLDGIVEFMDGLPNFEELKSTPEEPKLLILDDFMDSLKDDDKLVQLFTRGAHHWSVSCVHICQALFFGGLRTARINAHYLVLMKSPADKLQVANLAKQMYPGKTKYFMEAFNDAVSQPFGYLFVDCSPSTPEEHRLSTNVFPYEYQTVYICK
jgi:hypothetical protein